MRNKQNIALGFVIVAVVLIVYGRVSRENLVAAAGYGTLALAFLVYFLTR